MTTTPAAQPDYAPIDALHRGNDGFITFHLAHGGTFQTLFSVEARQLAEMFPKHREGMQRDAFFSVNSFRKPHRKGALVKYVTAAFVDIDCYRYGIDHATALARIIRMQDDGEVPPCSITARSGRGLWAFWILTDEHTGRGPQAASPQALRLYRRVQSAIHGKLAALGTDAKDVARTARVPNSINRKCELRVAYWIQLDKSGQGFAYTLPELATALGVEIKPLPKVIAAVLETPAAGDARRRGWHAMHRNRLQQFETLRNLRGAFHEGCRNRAALIFVLALRHNRIDYGKIAGQLEEFCAECSPPLSRSEFHAALDSGMHRCYKLTDATISDWLDVTPEESALLNGWPSAARFGRRSVVAGGRGERTKARRALIMNLVNGSTTPSTRAMKSMLAEHGHHASPQTVLSDYIALGLRTKAPEPAILFTKSCPEHQHIRNPLLSAHPGAAYAQLKGIEARSVGEVGAAQGQA